MSYWQSKRVLITGADGFLGVNLTKGLVAANAKVLTLTRRPFRPDSMLRLSGLEHKLLASEVGSVEDLEKLRTLCKKYVIEIIFHLAALPLVEIGKDNPTRTFAVNIGGTWNILEAARENRVKKTVIVSTSHVYGDNPHLPYSEELFPQPSRPYETSKACADLLAQCYGESYDLDVVIPRFVNLYGPGDTNLSRLVPKVITTVLTGKAVHLWRSPAVRDFLYIDDAISALLMLARPGVGQDTNRIFNFGSGHPIAVVELAKQIVALADRPDAIIKLVPKPVDRRGEIIRQYVSIEKAKAELGWQPNVTLQDGLERTIDWYKQNFISRDIKQ